MQAQPAHTDDSVCLQTMLMSDDECVRKLALLIEHRDETRFDEIVALIGRLAFPIELT